MSLNPIIVVPAYKTNLSESERVSLKVLERVLGNKFPIRIAAPDRLEFDKNILASVEKIDWYKPEYFESILGYNKLMLSREFYQRYLEFSHILIYQLDCLVFNNKLLEWCEKDYSYIGPPWYENFEEKEGGKLWCVGNGGFSLRKVSDFLHVLKLEVNENQFCFSGGLTADYIPSNDPRRLIRNSILPSSVTTTVEDAVRYYPFNEDVFWSFEAVSVYDKFTKPTAKEALRFGIEVNPADSYYKNWFRIPFGCHGWPKYGRKFWETQIKARRLIP